IYEIRSKARIGDPAAVGADLRRIRNRVSSLSCRSSGASYQQRRAGLSVAHKNIVLTIRIRLVRHQIGRTTHEHHVSPIGARVMTAAVSVRADRSEIS